MTTDLERKTWDLIQRVLATGKAPKTYAAYTAVVAQWLHVAASQGWGPYLDDVPSGEAQRRLLFYLGYEVQVHKLKSRSLRGKISALRWHHVRDLRDNPIDGMETVKEFLKNLEKEDGPSCPKIPVPLPLLQLICLVLKQTRPADWQALLGAFTHGFCFLLRAGDYLADPDGKFCPGRGTTWGNVSICTVTFPSDGGSAIRKPEKLEDLPKLYAARKDIRESLVLFSGKNSLQTCQRTVAATYDTDTCPVGALAAMVERELQLNGKLPSENTALFELDDHSVLSRTKVNEILQEAAAAAGIPKARIATHSLRRGGCSAYMLSENCSELAVQHMGRWVGDSFKLYLYRDPEAMTQAQRDAHKLVPRFEPH